MGAGRGDRTTLLFFSLLRTNYLGTSSMDQITPIRLLHWPLFRVDAPGTQPDGPHFRDALLLAVVVSSLQPGSILVASGVKSPARFLWNGSSLLPVESVDRPGSLLRGWLATRVRTIEHRSVRSFEDSPRHQRCWHWRGTRGANFVQSPYLLRYYAATIQKRGRVSPTGRWTPIPNSAWTGFHD